MFDDLPNSRHIVEDVLVYSRTYEEHVALVRQLLQRSIDHKVSLNLSKFAFAQKKGKFEGYTIDGRSFRPDPALTEAIRHFPRPTSITEIRSFLAFANRSAISRTDSHRR